MRLPVRNPYVFQALVITFALVATALVYSPGLTGGFALDDYTNIVDNGALAIQSLSWNSLAHAVFSFQAGPLMRPISMLSFALNVYAAGLAPYSFKVTNLLIHLLNGVLVMLLLRQVVAVYRQRFTAHADAASLDLLAILTGALWLLHPLNAMPVLYVVQRETSLSSMFMLLGLNGYLWDRARLLHGRPAGWMIWLGMPVCIGLAMLSKESGALLPVYALAAEIFLFGFRRKDGGLERRTAWFFVIFLFLPACAGLGWALKPGGGVLNYNGRDFTLGERLLTETRVIWLYIRWTLIPDPRQLGLYHDDVAVSHSLLQPITTLWALLGIAALIASCLLLRRRLPLVAFGIAWFLGGQLMESTIFPLELVYEHRCYLPDLGLILAITSLVLPLQNMRPGRLMRYAAVVIMLGLCATLTWVRAYNWRDNLNFAAAEASHHPQSPYATYMLGQTYANLALMTDPSQYDNAVTSLRAASEVPNSTVIPDVSLVLVEAQLKGKVDADILPRIAAKVSDRKLTASDIQGLAALGECIDKGNCVVHDADVEAIFRSALHDPYLASQRDTHANILVIYGNYLGYMHHDLLRARELMGEAADLVPGEPQYQENKLTLDISLRDRERALADLGGLERLNYLGHLDAVIADLRRQIDALPASQKPR